MSRIWSRYAQDMVVRSYSQKLVGSCTSKWQRSAAFRSKDAEPLLLFVARVWFARCLALKGGHWLLLASRVHRCRLPDVRQDIPHVVRPSAVALAVPHAVRKGRWLGHQATRQCPRPQPRHPRPRPAARAPGAARARHEPAMKAWFSSARHGSHILYTISEAYQKHTRSISRPYR